MRKFAIVIAIAGAYVLGARAGRQRYEQIKDRAALLLPGRASVYLQIADVRDAVNLHKPEPPVLTHRPSPQHDTVRRDATT